MLVLVMMHEARKPKNWMWMGFESGAGEESKEATQDGTVQVSPRLADLFSNRDDDNSLFNAMANENDADVDTSDVETDGEEASRRQITERCFKQLNDEDLQRLFLDVQSLLDLEPLSPATLEDRKRIASRIDRHSSLAHDRSGPIGSRQR